MKRPTLLTFLLLIAIQFVSHAQTGNSAMVADIYQRASKFYEEDKFAEVVTLLERAETLSPTPDAKILYLKIRALNSLYTKDATYGTALEKAVLLFTSVAQAQNYPAQKIAEVRQIGQETAKRKQLMGEQSQRLVDETPVVFTGKIVYKVTRTIDGVIQPGYYKYERYVYGEYRRNIEWISDTEKYKVEYMEKRYNSFEIFKGGKDTNLFTYVPDPSKKSTYDYCSVIKKDILSDIKVLGRKCLGIQFGITTYHYVPNMVHANYVISEKGVHGDNIAFMCLEKIPNSSIPLKIIKEGKTKSGKSDIIEYTASEIIPMNLSEDDFLVPGRLWRIYPREKLDSRLY